jgi:hypothetical protein
MLGYGDTVDELAAPLRVAGYCLAAAASHNRLPRGRTVRGAAVQDCGKQADRDGLVGQGRWGLLQGAAPRGLLQDYRRDCDLILTGGSD